MDNSKYYNALVKQWEESDFPTKIWTGAPYKGRLLW